jgi:hypothetical protein
MREKMVAAFDRDVRMAGAQNFEEGMEKAKMVCGILTSMIVFANNFIQEIRTVEDLRKKFDDRMSLSEREQAVLLIALENLPQMVRLGLTAFTQKFVSILPPLTTGRKPAISSGQAKEVLVYVSQLNLQGVSMPIAKTRAAQKFGCSRRTIDRLWANRSALTSESPPTIQELIDMLLRQGNADGWKMPVD